MEALNISPTSCHCVVAFLIHRVIRALVANDILPLVLITSGVPQGLVLRNYTRKCHVLVKTINSLLPSTQIALKIQTKLSPLQLPRWIKLVSSGLQLLFHPLWCRNINCDLVSKYFLTSRLSHSFCKMFSEAKRCLDAYHLNLSGSLGNWKELNISTVFDVIIQMRTYLYSLFAPIICPYCLLFFFGLSLQNCPSVS